FDPIEARKAGKAVLLVQAGIHAGEPDGTDAGMMLIRNLAGRKIQPPQNVVLLFIPTINPEGCLRRGAYNRINQNGPEEMGWRTNARNINLNRDFIKADSREIRAFLDVYNAWLPDMFIDCHTTDGADYQYVMTYDLTDMCLLGDEQNHWQQYEYLKPLIEHMYSKNFPMFRYVTFKRWHDPKSGLVRWIPSPMLSEGYAAARNRPGLLLETHMLKPYAQRVDAAYEVLRFTLDNINTNHGKLTRLNREADAATAKMAAANIPVPVEFDSYADSVLFNFEGVAYDVVKSDVTGGEWHRYSNIPEIQKIWYYDKPKPVAFAQLPAAYIFEPAWTEIIQILDAHGIRYTVLQRSVEVEVEATKLIHVKWSAEPYEGRQMISGFNTEVLPLTKRSFPAGSIVVSTAVPEAKVLAHMFEPVSRASLVRWGYFNAVFEQKEYAESYVMETMAREMMSNNRQLKLEFEEKIKTDSTFAGNQRAIVNWFYQQSPYWDKNKDVIPVYRLSTNALHSIMKKD
ncbi:MAG TPA: M14 family zinc carboxypeptidase, partial [Bacteroidales bacterium]|nr:M14 family zinc carboxypeptidase [Bacteroidales bacterium]